MILDYLGHSEFIAILKNASWQDVTILSDTWLSNYVVGDLMGRNPTFDINYDILNHIDAIFISHTHCDHLDPYTLIKLYKNLKNSPTLLLPETMLFLKDIFLEYLWEIKIIAMRNKEKYDINGITVRGYIFENENITNEDDVMSLFISNEKEIIYTEVDTIPPSNESTQNYLYKIFTEKNYESVVYLATRNELEGNLKLLDIEEREERKKFAQEYKNMREEEIEFEYSKFEQGADFRDIYKIKNFIRLFIGQGVTYPKALNNEFLKLHLMTLQDEKNIEKQIASEYGYNFPIDALEAGQRFEIKNGKIKKWDFIPYIRNLDFQIPQADITLLLKRNYANWPLQNTQREIQNQKSIIDNLLNTRFLPYRLWNSEDNLKNAIVKNENRKYTIAIKYGTKENFETVYYIFHFGQIKFEVWESKNGYFDEDYWASDIEDFYNWVQELYSNFLHTLTPWKAYRFWTSLGANFLNNDIVKRKFELHFKRAQEGRTPDEFVLDFYNQISS